jgi:ubiquinone/menaquinone biosynthesis C-methylase UbiE
MPDVDVEQLTQRQRRELEYHRTRAQEHRQLLSQPVSWDVLERPGTRWWNAYWQMFAFLVGCKLQGKSVLVVGCGFGDDALRLAKLGARVSAFDLSEDSLSIARQLATREGLDVAFDQMPAEALTYADNSFDFIVARDILHHVDIGKTMRELVRVAKPGAMFVVDEIYSHSITDKIRHSSLVTRTLYPRMQQRIYGEGTPYITEDERKLNELDLAQICQPLGPFVLREYFNFVVTRLIPERSDWHAKVDRAVLSALRPVARFLAGRVLFVAPFRK